MKVVVAPEREFPPGTRRIIKAGARSIGVFRVGDRFFAIRNRCPHQGGPLCEGLVLGAAEASGPGQPQVTETMLLACPWHGWEYDLETGQSYVGGGDPGVRSYDVGLQAGGALAGELEQAQTERVPGPFLAETFDVHVEDEYVVLQT